MSRLKELLHSFRADPCNTQQTPVQACKPVAQHMHTVQQARLDASYPARAANLMPLTANEKATIRTWLAHIGETDPAIIADVLEKCRTDPEAQDYFTGRANNLFP